MLGIPRSFELLFLALATLRQEASAQVVEDRCLNLPNLAHLEESGTTIISSNRVSGNTTVQTWGACGNTPVPVSAPLCRVRFTVRTSNSSAVNAEAWLPDQWYGRFLGVGNQGVGGCIDYGLLNYGSSLHFASFATNGGLDGDQARSYYHQPEMLQDFAGRSIHAVTEVGKQIVDAYYPQPHAKSYFIGCSTGGRQGIWSAQNWPEDFDGILAGAPTTNWNFVLGSLGLLFRATGYPEGDSSPSHIPTELWTLIRAEIIKQCDGLDGVQDGLVEDGEACFDWLRLGVLRCSNFTGAKEGVTCITDAQMDALLSIYSAKTGEDEEEVLYPGSNLGADLSLEGDNNLLSGKFFDYVGEWWKYVIYEDPNHDLGNFSLSDILTANRLDPSNISAVSGDFSDFHARGGKLVAYTGSHDSIVPVGNSKNFYNLTLSTMGESSLNAFYRLFVVPGMDHCGTSKSEGPFMIGHHSPSPQQIRNDSEHNVLLALVDWVEGGRAVDSIVGTSTEGEERSLSRFVTAMSVRNGAGSTSRSRIAGQFLGMLLVTPLWWWLMGFVLSI